MPEKPALDEHPTDPGSPAGATASGEAGERRREGVHSSGTNGMEGHGQVEKEAYVTLVTTTKYLIGAEVLAKSLRALAASRPLVALVDASLPVSIRAAPGVSRPDQIALLQRG
jgi:hypothetical protein